MIKRLVNVIMVSTLLFGSYVIIEQSNESNLYGSGMVKSGNEDHPEY